MVKAAAYYNVPPWELLAAEGSYGFYHIALASIDAEGHAEKQHERRNRRKNR